MSQGSGMGAQVTKANDDGHIVSKSSVVAIPGGAGYIGSVLSRLLLDEGYSVRVLDRCFFGEEPLAACRAAGERFELLRVDTRETDASHFAGTDMVVDLAGLSNDPSCALDEGLTHSINVGGGTAVLEAAQAAGVRRYVYQSSCSVYGTAGEDFLDENSVLAPVSEYSRSKVEMEQQVLKAEGPSFEVVIARSGTVFGLSPRMRFDLAINTMTLAAVRTGRIEIHGGGNQWRPLVHVLDAARALSCLLRAPADAISGRVFNVGDTRYNYRVSAIAEQVASLIPGTGIVTYPESKDRRDYRCDFTRIENELGFTAMTSPVSGIEEILAALKAGVVDTGVKTMTVDYYRHLMSMDSSVLAKAG